MLLQTCGGQLTLINNDGYNLHVSPWIHTCTRSSVNGWRKIESIAVIQAITTTRLFGWLTGLITSQRYRLYQLQQPQQGSKYNKK